MPNEPIDSRTVLVDTSVWLGFIRGHAVAVSLMERLTHRHGAPGIAVCGTVLQEVMQGSRNERELAELRTRLSIWEFEPETPEDFDTAAGIYARLRWRGRTVPAQDCLVAAVALRTNRSLAAHDRHFDEISGLKLIKV
ncbi:MAG: PIN domain nuclease [Opitutus sp.]|nr:PIN domain nuclease [Opitutus sp.]